MKFRERERESHTPTESVAHIVNVPFRFERPTNATSGHAKHQKSSTISSVRKINTHREREGILRRCRKKNKRNDVFLAITLNLAPSLSQLKSRHTNILCFIERKEAQAFNLDSVLFVLI